MFPFPMDWTKVKDKEGDDIVVTLSPVERAIVLSAILNYQYIGENAPQSMKISDSERDNFDAHMSSLASKLTV